MRPRRRSGHATPHRNPDRPAGLPHAVPPGRMGAGRSVSMRALPTRPRPMSNTLEKHLLHDRRNRPGGPSPVDVVTVQSQLAYGYAGNSATVPVLRMLGLRVVEVPTTLFSNTPFYPTLRGRVLPADWLAELLQGLDERGVSTRTGLLQSGYFGSV